MVDIVISSEADFYKLDQALKEIVERHTVRIKNKYRKHLLRTAQFLARSLRARISKAPYNYRSDKPGPWSRKGGRPAEKSVRIDVKNKDEIRVYIQDSGSSGFGVLPPSAYMALRISADGKPATYVEGAISAARKQLKKWIKG